MNEDIDPENFRRTVLGNGALPWILPMTCRFSDIAARGMAGNGKHEAEREDSTMLMDATMKAALPPLALPKREVHGTREANLGRVGTS